MNIHALTKTAIIAAVALLCLFLSGVISGAALSLAALAGLIPAVLVKECGYRYSFAAYLIAGVLGLVLIPEKTGCMLFLLLFGYYTSLKQWLEARGAPLFAWILKLLFANLIFLLCSFFFSWIFIAVLPTALTAVWIVWACYMVAFVIYDVAGTQWLRLYHSRIRQ